MSLSRAEWQEVRRIVQSKLEFPALRPGQKEALEALLAGKDTLTVLPTGSGKSAIYQVAALMIPGPTIVVSPLIALQLDQAQALEESDLGNVAVLNSLQPKSERERALDAFAAGELEFLLLAPEQLQCEETLARLRAAQPSLFVVDEAHCISEWGHSFRPDYLRLGEVVAELGHPLTLALTATASPSVRQEIIQRLGMRDPRVVVTGFDRPNIHLSVRCLTGEALKQRQLVELLRDEVGTGIVYVGTRAHAESVAQALVAAGHRAICYHAGLKRQQRLERQDAFMSGDIQVMVATCAFGMGIDKPDVRFVVHYDVSDGLDAYYQEIGRAGRDGEPARATLFFSDKDLNLKRFFAAGARLSEDELSAVLGALSSLPAGSTVAEIRERTHLTLAKVERALARLEDLGTIRRRSDQLMLLAAAELAAQRIGVALSAQEALLEQRTQRIEEMRAYARARTCRRALLLEHFGAEAESCSGCDNCDQPLAGAA